MATNDKVLVSFDDDAFPATDRHAKPNVSVTSDEPFRAIDYANDDKTHILLAASGSLATGILAQVINELRNHPDIIIRVVLDAAAAKYISREHLINKPNVQAVYTDDDWPEHERNEPDTFLNYELRSCLDFMLVAPCSANTISSMVALKGDNLITSILQIFDVDGELNPPGRVGRFKYLAIAPALDSVTWRHPGMKENIEILRTRWAYVKTFAAGQQKAISWAVVILRLANETAGGFDHLKDNCNMQLDAVMEEVHWELSKFENTHFMYTPGF